MSAQLQRIMASYGVATRPALLRAIRDEWSLETGERFSLRAADAILDGMLEAEYQRIEGGAYDAAPGAAPATDPADAYERGLATLDADAAFERHLENLGEEER